MEMTLEACTLIIRSSMWHYKCFCLLDYFNVFSRRNKYRNNLFR